MIFNTVAYFLWFLLPAAILFRVVPAGGRSWVCAGTGAAFFVYFSLTQHGGWFGAACLGILLWESFFSRFYRPGSVLCLVGVAQGVAVLVAFKYWNFLTGLLTGAPTPAENPLAWAGAFLPLGISFFTFEFIHYAVDRHRGTAERGKLGDYLAFILFFPTMVAGPIKRYQDFAPKLAAPSLDWALDWQRGITRILAGLVKKFALADFLAAFTGNLHADAILAADRRMLLLWLLAYGFKIYFDFSAYSDIAIGSARLFGIRVPENFDWPYLQRNIAAFWRHWHISLSRWLTDYVFIPLGGSRVAPARVYGNLLATLLVSGVWHGAGLNFLAWGAWHGLLLCAHRAWRAWRPKPSRLPLAALASWALTFVLVNLGWAFFCMDLPTALLFFRRLLLP